jgi:hypothetical protein
MSNTADHLRDLARNMDLQKGGKHECLRRLIIGGYFDSGQTTDQLITEIRQTSGVRIRPGEVHAYMKKFLNKGILRTVHNEHSHASLWVLACEEAVKAAKTVGQSHPKEEISDANERSGEKNSQILPVSGHSKIEATRILFIAANPKDTDHLALQEEAREIEEKIRASKHRDSFEFISKWAVRSEDLFQHFNQFLPHVVHFSGHGSDLDLLFLNSAGDAKPVSKIALKQLFRTLKNNIRVVVLNTCYSRAHALAITAVIDCTIGMKKSIGDREAIVFAAAFYQSLGFGNSVKKAFDSGVAAMMTIEGTKQKDCPKLIVRKGVDADKIFLAGH